MPPISSIGPTYYVNTVSVEPLDSRTYRSIELCSNDVGTARTWAERSLADSSEPAEIQSESETDKYFQFSYAVPSRSELSLMRALKCSYFSPSIDKLSAAWNFGRPSDAEIGTLGVDMTADDVRQFAEYDWFHNWSSDNGANWLETRVSEGRSVVVDLYSTEFSMADFGLCDMIGFDRWRYVFDRETRKVRLTYENLDEVRGQCHPDPSLN